MNTATRTLVNYLDVPQTLKDLYDIDGLYVSHAPYYRWFIGLEVGPEMLGYRPIVTREQADRFRTEAARRASLNPDVSLLKTPQSRVYAMLGSFGMLMESVWFFDPTTGRPRIPISDIIGIKIVLEMIFDNYAGEDWMTTDFALQLIKKFVEEEPENLMLGFDLWFGVGSVGWMNADEKQGVIEAIADAMSEEARAGLRKLWIQKGGDAGVFASLWTEYVVKMEEARLLYTNIPFVADVRLGRGQYVYILEGLKIGHTIDQIYYWAVREYSRIEAEMNRLARLAEKKDWREYLDSVVVGLEPTEENLMQMYRISEAELRAIFEVNGVFATPENYSWEFRLTPPSERQNVPLAMFVPAPYFASVRKGSFYITPCDGDLVAWGEHSLNCRLTAAHELFGHGVCDGYATRIPNMYSAIRQSMLLAYEGVAVSMEGLELRCEGTTQNLVDMMVILKSLAFRAARVIAELEWHVGDKSLEQITMEYAHRAGISLKMAQRDIRRMTTTTWEFLSYFLGAAGVESLGKLMGGTIPALRYLIENTAGVVPPHIAAWAEELIDRPEDFDWLGETEMVEISRRLFPTYK